MDITKELYLISDPSHLIKTTRNCLLQSRHNSKQRLMLNNGHYLLWTDIIDLYKYDQARDCNQLIIAHKLTHKHLYPAGYEKMKVNLAAQVLSRSVAVNVKNEELKKFLLLMNTFFDICNSTLTSHKPASKPFTKSNDARITWLKDVFINYLENWELFVTNQEKRDGTNFTNKEKQKMMLSKETHYGLLLTAKSLISVTQEMLNCGAKYVILRRLSQDVLEHFFGCVRQQGASRNNPNILQFGQAAHHLNSTRGIKRKLGSTKGNVEQSDSTE